MNRAFMARLFESYFRHRWLNLLPLFLMLVGGITWLVVTKPEYTSRGTVYVQGGTLLATLAADTTSQPAWSSPAKATSDDMNSLLQSDSFIRSVIAKSDLESEMQRGPRIADLTVIKVRSSVWTATLGQNMVLIGAAYTSPTVAQQLSSGVIQNYIQWRVNTGSNEGATAQGYFEKLVPQYQSDVVTARQDLQAYLVQHPDPVRGERPTEETFQIDRLQAAVQDATQRLSDTVSKAEKAKLAGARSTIDVGQIYSVIDAPQAAAEPSTSRRKQAINLAVFVVAGLLLSVVMVVGESVFDTSLRFPPEVQQKLGVPVLGALPDVRTAPKPSEDRGAETAPSGGAATSGSHDQPVPPQVAVPPVGGAAQGA